MTESQGFPTVQLYPNGLIVDHYTTEVDEWVENPVTATAVVWRAYELSRDNFFATADALDRDILNHHIQEHIAKTGHPAAVPTTGRARQYGFGWRCGKPTCRYRWGGIE